MRLFQRPHFGAAVGALVCWTFSWWPSLLPRSWVMQGLVSGVSAALGWLIGTVLGRLCWLGLKRTEWISARVRQLSWYGVVALLTVACAFAVVVWRLWQNDQREMMGMPGLGLLLGLPAILASVVVLALLVLIGRLVAAGVRGIDNLVARVITPAWGRAVTAGVVVVLAVVGIRAGGDRFVAWADTSFGVVNAGTPYGVAQPEAATLSGSPQSLVSWDSLGHQGRGFTGDVPSAADIEAFWADAGRTDAPAVIDPVRVYVGLDSVDDLDTRVDEALAEMDRVGAFDREVLVVATATGTGWINPDAARTIEFMYGGDTAIVSVQYSFLPSWVAFVIDPTVAVDAGIALFDAVHERWSAMPASDRPTLVAFGESLGSYGAEAAFDRGGLVESFGDLSERVDAALLVGPTTHNPLFTGLVAERDADTPSWRPARADLPEVRVANDLAEVQSLAWTDAGNSWSKPRALYLFHPTDAIGLWSIDTLWSPPEWVDRPLGVGVAAQTRWFPVVTWVQETADLMAGFSAVPGFGHDYRNEFVAAWAAVAAPDGWTEDDGDRLQAYLELG